MHSPSPGALNGVTVVDLTRVLSGPYCTMLLADLGARVIKIEPPGGDDTRRFPPFKDGQSLYFAAFNRGKESIALDLTKPEDREILDRLLESADILVDNYRPGVMARLGYTPGRITTKWPRLIHASVSGFGQTGPDAQRPAYDLMIQAMGGVMSVTGAEGGGPARVGTSLVDIGSGMFAVIGLLAALHRRDVTGVGGTVDVGMLDSQVALLEHALLRAQVGEAPVRLGARFPTIAPSDAFQTADGWIVMGCVTPKQYEAAMTVLGRADLITDPRFSKPADRVTNHAILKTEIEAVMRTNSSAHWDKLLTASAVPCGVVRTMSELLTDPQLQSRNMLQEHDGVLYPGNPIKISGTSDTRTGAVPTLDGNRKDILARS